MKLLLCLCVGTVLHTSLIKWLAMRVAMTYHSYKTLLILHNDHYLVVMLMM